MGLKKYFLILFYRLKSIFQYPVDIFFGISGTILWHLPNFVLINIIFENITNLNYDKELLILLYGLSVFGDGIQHTFAEALWQFGNNFIKTANYDLVIVKPMSNFIQIITSRFDIDGFGGILWGLICSFYGFSIINETNNISMALLFLGLLNAAIVFLAINIFTSSFAFLLQDNFYLTHTIFQLHMFARYPKDIFPKVIGVILTFVLPLFGATYYPIKALMSNLWKNMIIILIFNIIILLSSLLLWKLFSFFYKSCGS